jgi:hypothetical protein
MALRATEGNENRPVAKMRRTKWSVEAGFSTERSGQNTLAISEMTG